jgi:hypothetical protein
LAARREQIIGLGRLAHYPIARFWKMASKRGWPGVKAHQFRSAVDGQGKLDARIAQLQALHGLF